ncbi:MAG: hypothetical protein ACR2KS_04235 [Candidatus Eremiobacter antarcticus]|nr:hypothetical protein [Candidatus Eremiobacteraeota bacterium]MBC5808852.1 hypothetical protein [Candidatus Eremiobacteraeota bacterium]
MIARASDHEDEAPSDSGEAVEVAIDGPGYNADSLFDGPVGHGFRAGLDFGIHVAAAVAGYPFRDPAADIRSALEHATRRMRELHTAQTEETAGEMRTLDQRRAEMRSLAKDELRRGLERISFPPGDKK